MEHGSIRLARAALIGALAFGIAQATSADGGATTYDPYPGPSPWGPDDEAGASNTQTPAKVLEAKRLIKTGKVYRLGHVYEPGLPVFPGADTLSIELHAPSQVGSQIVNLETMHGAFAQMGTQFDGFTHFGLLPTGSSDPDDALYYNGFTGADIATPQGFTHLGVENIKPFVTRGVLLDIRRHANGGQKLAAGQEITLPMVLATLHAQRMKPADIGIGDVVLFVTGWEENWSLGTVGYYVDPSVGLIEPGIGLPVAQWLVSKGVACVGADNWGIEVAPPGPPPAPGVIFPVHHHLLVKSGVFMQESMVLSELAADMAADLDGPGGGEDADLASSQEAAQGHHHHGRGAYEFFYVYSPLPLRGATGSPGIPLAIR